jgi:hypothetical protein
MMWPRTGTQEWYEHAAALHEEAAERAFARGDGERYEQLRDRALRARQQAQEAPHASPADGGGRPGRPG